MTKSTFYSNYLYFSNQPTTPPWFVDLNESHGSVMVRPLVQASLPHTLLSSSVSSALSHRAILTSSLSILFYAFTLSNHPGPASSSRTSLGKLLLLLLPACHGRGNEVQGEPGWPGTCYVDQASLRFRAVPPASASRLLGSQV